MMIDWLRKNDVTRELVNVFGITRNKIIVKRLDRLIARGSRVVDIGAGTCQVDSMLIERGYQVTPVDVKNISFTPSLSPVIYDGKKLPFPNNEFDVAIIVVVLHHTPEPEMIIKEAMRVAKKLVITEEIYTTPFNRQMTYFFDSLVNLEFVGHPHTNKTDEEWRS